IAGRDSSTAHQDFAVFREFDFASVQHFADGTLSQAEGVIDADERRGFGQAVALNHGVAQAVPEFLGRAVEGCAAGDESPEFPAKLAPDAAKGPPAAQEVLAFGCAECGLKLLETVVPGKITLD